MTDLVEEYIESRHRLGVQLHFEGWALRSFARYADDSGHRGPLTTELAVRGPGSQLMPHRLTRPGGSAWSVSSPATASSSTPAPRSHPRACWAGHRVGLPPISTRSPNWGHCWPPLEG